MQKILRGVLALTSLTLVAFSGATAFAESHRLVTSADPFFMQVSPILEAKCASCHTASNKFSLMPKGKMLNRLDLTNYLNGKESHLPNNMLERLQAVVQKGSMPPAPYTWLHHDTKLTDDDKQLLLKWIQSQSQQ